MRGAWRKGFDAAVAGLSLSVCPYGDKRKSCGRLTWSRAFIAAWRDGWDAGRQQNPITTYYSDRARSGQSTSAG